MLVEALNGALRETLGFDIRPMDFMNDQPNGKEVV